MSSPFDMFVPWGLAIVLFKVSSRQARNSLFKSDSLKGKITATKAPLVETKRG